MAVPAKKVKDTQQAAYKSRPNVPRWRIQHKNFAHKCSYLNMTENINKRLTLYDVLGVPAGASPQQIKQSYRKLAMKVRHERRI